MDGAEPDADADASGGGRDLDAAARFTEDLIMEILARLPARSLHRFKCVSKQWLRLISDADRRDKLAQTLAGFFYIGYEPSPSTEKSLRFTSALGAAGPSGPPFMVDPAALSLPPEYAEMVHRVDCCNGLLLLRCWKPGGSDGFCYAVVNPATDEWTALPDSPTHGALCAAVRLAFDPAASPVFHVFEFESRSLSGHTTSVDIYSSAPGAWIHRECGGWGDITLRDESSAVFYDGLLRLAPLEPLIVEVDVKGDTWRSIPKPTDPDDDGFLGGVEPGFIAESQGRLHFINSLEYHHRILCIWELHDDGVWFKKHSVNLRNLFHGMWDFRVGLSCSVIGLHPDCNIIYFLQGKNHTLVSYSMNRREKNIICDIGFTNYMRYVPYVPLFSRGLLSSSSLAHEG